MKLGVGVGVSRRCQEGKCGRGTNTCNSLEIICVALSVWKVTALRERMLAQGRVACLKAVGKMVPKLLGLN